MHVPNALKLSEPRVVTPEESCCKGGQNEGDVL